MIEKRGIQTTQQTEGSQETKLREDKNSKREEQLVKPQHRDHSKRLRWHKSFNSSNDFSLSSKDWRFRSHHTIHTKHPGTKFQMSELCFPSHWCQHNSKVNGRSFKSNLFNSKEILRWIRSSLIFAKCYCKRTFTLVKEAKSTS